MSVPLLWGLSELSPRWHIQTFDGKVESKAVWELWGCQGGSCWSSLSSSAWSRARVAIGTGLPHDSDMDLRVMSPSEGKLNVTNTYVDWTHTVLTLLLFLSTSQSPG